jgi:hypothetical protein
MKVNHEDVNRNAYIIVGPVAEKSLRDYPACGMWADREDMSNPVEWLRKQRDSSRYDY